MWIEIQKSYNFCGFDSIKVIFLQKNSKMIERKLKTVISQRLNTEKVIIVLGARQVGKTTLLKNLFANNDDLLWLNGDEMDVQELFANISSSRLKAIFGNKKIIVIDEAQRISDIGLRLKLVADMCFPAIN